MTTGVAKWRKPRDLVDPCGSTVLSHKGYGILKEGNNELVAYLKEYLTAKPRVNPSAPGANMVKPFPVYKENSTRLYIPRAFGLEWFGAPTKDQIEDGERCERLRFHGSLRPEQHVPVEEFLAATRDPRRRGGIISVGCGFGKTVLGLYLSSVLGVKTIIICHKEFLINQWRERIAQYLPSARIGLIKAKCVDVEDRDIIIASLQSLAMKEYDKHVFAGIGLVIADEAHHLSAEVFSQALPKVTCRYMLGLSATLDRADGLRKVFEWYLGRPVFELKKRADASMIVDMIPFYDPNPEYGRERFLWNGKLNSAQMMNAICGYTPRNERIVEELARVLEAEPERRVLILSARRNHLQVLDKMLKARFPSRTTGYYVGGMKEQQLKESESKDIILATLSMVSEGFDVPVLNTLVLASPVSAIEQPIGRIQRQKANERTHTPYTIDMWDTFSIFQGQGKRRMAFYKKQGYDVKGDCDDDAESKPQSIDFIQDDDE